MSETWRPVLGYEGVYEVSDYGRLRSVHRTVPNGHGRMKAIRGVPIRDAVNPKHQYHQIVLHRGGQAKNAYIHVLVASAFHGSRPEGMEVRHLDGNKDNNHASNLAWGTMSENRQDTVRHGRHPCARRTECPLGHPLCAPNLTAASTRRGTRSCLSCSRARAFLIDHPELDLVTTADRYLADLVGVK